MRIVLVQKILCDHQKCENETLNYNTVYKNDYRTVQDKLFANVTASSFSSASFAPVKNRKKVFTALKK